MGVLGENFQNQHGSVDPVELSRERAAQESDLSGHKNFTIRLGFGTTPNTEFAFQAVDFDQGRGTKVDEYYTDLLDKNSHRDHVMTLDEFKAVMDDPKYTQIKDEIAQAIEGSDLNENRQIFLLTELGISNESPAQVLNASVSTDFNQ